MRPCPSVTTWCWHLPRPWLPSLVHSPCPAVWSLFSLKKVIAPLFLGNCEFSLSDSSLRPLTHPTTSVQLPEAKACPESWCQGSWTESRGGNGQRKKQRSEAWAPELAGSGEQLAVHKVHWHRGLHVPPHSSGGGFPYPCPQVEGPRQVTCLVGAHRRKGGTQDRKGPQPETAPALLPTRPPPRNSPPSQPSQNMATLMTEQPPIPCPGQKGYRFCRRVEI